MFFAQPRKFNQTITGILAVFSLAVAGVLAYSAAPGSVAADSSRRVGLTERTNHRVRVPSAAAAANAVQPMNPMMFVSITVDPDRDTPEVLKQYADTFGADLKGWAFLTGAPAAIRDVTHRYGVFAAKTANGDVDHTFLTSIVDRNGVLRVQYLGVRFDPDEFRRDLLNLVKEQ